jgi:hypothetical protein
MSSVTKLGNGIDGNFAWAFISLVGDDMVSWIHDCDSAERDLKGLCHITDKALLARLGLRRHSLALSKGFQKCAFRNSIWRIVPSKIVIFIHQLTSCLHRQLAKCKLPIANGE